MQDREFFNKAALEKGGYQTYPDAEYTRILASTGILGERRGTKVLDAGCGSGAFTRALRGHGFDMTGIDISDELVAVAQKAAGDGAFFCGDIFAMPFPAGIFDIVFCGAVLHHFPDRLADAAGEFMRVLKPHGRVYLFEPYAGCLNSFVYYTLMKYDRTDEEKALWPATVEREFARAGFSRLEYATITGVEHLYPSGRPSVPRKAAVLLRRIFTGAFHNVYFTGRLAKGRRP